MLKDVTIGQYYSEKSIIHELDPRVKIRAVLSVILLSLFDRNIYLFGLLTVFFFVTLIMAKVPVVHILKGMSGLIIFIFVCSLINAFTTYGDILLRIGVFKITTEGIIKSGFIFWRMLLIIFVSSLLMYTTTPTELTDGLEKCFAIKGSIAMGITIALRFIPVLMEELDRIMKAQEMRGAEFDKGGPIKRIKGLRTVIIPLFQNSIDRASNLADAMDARCYTGGKSRSKLRQLKYGRNDYIAYMVLLLLIMVGIYFIIKF
ncbi:MAG: energy-coupling factor transporter transmembrane protein EcfT [Lachnospiraceae bacterium]|nr:energy-coupling factor transporter transmembrane protein EcfT [Lachnospiraceae bacterium]